MNNQSLFLPQIEGLRAFAVIAVILYHFSKMLLPNGYLGVDIVLDKEHGPLMLELNARPGLNIQIANREGGLLRYKKIEARAHTYQDNVKERVHFSKNAL